MIERPTACKMVTAPKDTKTAQAESEDKGAIKGQAQAFRRVIGRSKRCFEGIKQ